jgi:hypothetical protein
VCRSCLSSRNVGQVPGAELRATAPCDCLEPLRRAAWSWGEKVMAACGTTVEELSEATSVDDMDVKPLASHQAFEVHELLAVASLLVVEWPAPHAAFEQHSDCGRAIRSYATAQVLGVLSEAAAVHVLTSDDRPTGEQDGLPVQRLDPSGASLRRGHWPFTVLASLSSHSSWLWRRTVTISDASGQATTTRSPRTYLTRPGP